MIVHALFSEPVDAEVLEALAGTGDDLRLHSLGLHSSSTSAAVAPSAWSRGARRLVAELDAGGATLTSGDAVHVLHALDPGAWVVATAARRRVDLPLVLRATDGPLRPPGSPPVPDTVLLACLCQADAVGVPSLGARRDLMRRKVSGDRIQVVPEVPSGYTVAPHDPPLGRHVVLFDDGRPDRALLRLRAAAPSLGRSAVVTVADRRVATRERVALLDRADVVVCGGAADREAVQAMWRGRAVVAPDTPLMDDVVVDRITGRLFRAGDGDDLLMALARVLGSPFSVQAHGVAGRRRAEERYAAPSRAAALSRLHEVAMSRRAVVP